MVGKDWTINAALKVWILLLMECWVLLGFQQNIMFYMKYIKCNVLIATISVSKTKSGSDLEITA